METSNIWLVQQWVDTAMHTHECRLMIVHALHSGHTKENLWSARFLQAGLCWRKLGFAQIYSE
ncbi:hypothetical protein, partial [Achromobacter aegrifaciens]|uniref:hypothetical protein n=1 Tax=Achromobacter aegrifaciens TaxID=1287736 RepID=UPI002868E5AE